MYVFELSFMKQKTLAQILDVDNAWEDLAGLINLSADEVMMCRKASSRGQSSAGELLGLIGSLGYPVDQLFKLLYKMKHCKGMKVLSDSVDAKCLKLLEKLNPDNSSGMNFSHEYETVLLAPSTSDKPFEEQSKKVIKSAAGSSPQRKLLC